MFRPHNPWYLKFCYLPIWLRNLWLHTTGIILLAMFIIITIEVRNWPAALVGHTPCERGTPPHLPWGPPPPAVSMGSNEGDLEGGGRTRYENIATNFNDEAQPSSTSSKKRNTKRGRPCTLQLKQDTQFASYMYVYGFIHDVSMHPIASTYCICMYIVPHSLSPGQSGQRHSGLTRLAPVPISCSRNPGNHSSMRASTLSTMEQSSLVPALVAGTIMSKMSFSPATNSIRK